MNEYEVFTGLTNFLLNGVTCDGGWDTEPGASKETNPLNTAEALCGLICARPQLRVVGKLPNNYDKIIENAIKYLFSTQLPSGGWATGSAYRNQKDPPPKGNSVSTCFALWALLLSDDLLVRNPDTVNHISKALGFFMQCKSKDGLYQYCPDLDTPSMVSSAYVLLSFALILSCQHIVDSLTKEKLLQTENALKDLVDCLCESDFIVAAKSQRIAAILIYLSIQYLTGSPFLTKRTHNKIEKIYHTVISDLSLEDCTTPYIESQVVREKEKTRRDFTHYVPVWMLRIYSFCDGASDIPKYRFQVLNAVIDNIDPEYYGVSIGHGNKRTIWATGITLYTLSVFASNYEFTNILKQEGVQMSDNRKVFVVHGRDSDFTGKITRFLSTLSLQPLEWETVAQATGKATPTTHEIILKGFELAQAIVILMTGDDEGNLKKEFHKTEDGELERKLSPQPRLNVVYEAGLAFGMNPNRTLIVKKPGHLRKISDVDGFNYIVYDGTPENRNAMVGRLRTAGCSVDISGSNWLRIS